MKRPLILVIVLIVALGAALPYAPVDFLKFPIERALERGLGRQVQVDRVSLTLFSGPGVSLDGVTIHEDSRAGIEPFAYANTLDARLSLLPLLRGHLEFSSLHLNDATFNLVKPADAPWNFQMLLDRARLAAGGPPGNLPSLALPAIKVRGGRVNFKFSQTKSVLYFDDTDLDVSPGEGGAVELRFSGIPARTDRSSQNFGRFFVRGIASPSATGQHLNLRVELEPSALDAVARLFDNGGPALQGVVSLDAQVTGEPANLKVKGIIQMESAGQWRVGYEGKLDLIGQTLELDSTSPADLNTRLHVSTRDLLTTPQWEASASFLDTPLGAAADMARKLGVPLSDKMTAEGVVAGSVRYRNTEGLGGNIEIRDSALTMPGVAPLRIPTATIFLKGKTIVAGPNTVNLGEEESAEVEATYQAGEGGGTELKITTRRMNIADLRALGVPRAGAIPLLDRVADGTWRGSLLYSQPPATAGNWTGDFDVQDTQIQVDGIADPVRILSAAASIKTEDVTVTRIRAKVGDIAFGGEYHWTADRTTPQRFRLQIAEADSAEIERLFQPTIAREGGLLARTLRLGAAGAPPEWLSGRNAEGVISIQDLTVADTHLRVNSARVVWDGPDVTVSGLQGKVADATLVGELRVDLSGGAPSYRFEGKLEDVAYKGGKVDFTGKVTAAGSGRALLTSTRAEGHLRGRAIAFSPDADFRRVSGRFQVTMTAAGPRWKLSALEVTQGTDNLSGAGATQADGRLVLDLTGGGRQMRYP
jgi:hypothetical protein